MRRKTFFYYTLLESGNMCNEVVNEPLPTYPHSNTLRFSSYLDMAYYKYARTAFIKSTKLPKNCKACPIDSLCGGYHKTTMCRVLWRKIWEYVK